MALECLFIHSEKLEVGVYELHFESPMLMIELTITMIQVTLIAVG
jgi:hypothetical protein